MFINDIACISYTLKKQYKKDQKLSCKGTGKMFTLPLIGQALQFGFIFVQKTCKFSIPQS